MKKHIPNIITLLNLFFGCLAIFFVLNKSFDAVLVCYLLSIVMDFLDGAVARFLGVSSPVGKELDSLADMVSFGVVPGMIFFMLLGGEDYDINSSPLSVALLGFIFTLLAALRLANFNIDTRQSVDFIGLNTPTATAFVIGLLLIFEHNSFGLASFVSNPLFLIPTIFTLSYLMISEFSMFSGKFKGLKWDGNEIRIIFVLLAVLQFIFLNYAAFSFIVITYILLSIVNNIWFADRDIK